MGDEIPEPGTKEAITQGCTCEDIPTKDGSKLFWLSKDCSLHWHEKDIGEQEIPLDIKSL